MTSHFQPTGTSARCTSEQNGSDGFSKNFNLPNITEFESLIVVEPMDDQDNGITKKPDDVATSTDSSKSLRNSIKKKTSFAEVPKVLSYTENDQRTTVAYEEVEKMDNKTIDEALSEKMEIVSVSMDSAYSDAEYEAECNNLEPPGARLEQISQRIFATILPDNETPEQRHCDLVQAQRRLFELATDSSVMVINCGKPNAQLPTIFQLVQNCPFDLDGFPDLATFAAFCERAHDWLMVAECHVLLLHAEGTVAGTRLALLIRALSFYYEGSEQYDQTTSSMLRQYVTSYPNGLLRFPVAWLRYSSYMRLFSPEKCLSILRAPIGIYNLVLYNFPVFEENKLRFFIKFYCGHPLHPVYTTQIHDFHGSNFSNLLLTFSTIPEDKSINVGLRLQGDIALIAYHCRPYPSKRLRLFRLHFHSCQGINDPIAFQHGDFDDICEALPLKMRLELYCKNPRLAPIALTESREEKLPAMSNFGYNCVSETQSVCLLKQTVGVKSPDDAVRRHDSLEHIPSFYPKLTQRTICIDTFERLERNRLISDQLYSQGARTSITHRGQPFEPLSNNVDELMNRHGHHAEFTVHRSTRVTNSGHRDSADQTALQESHINVWEHEQSVRETPDLMLPPVTSRVPKRDHKRKRTVGQRLAELLSVGKSGKEQSAESDTDSDDLSADLHKPSSASQSDNDSTNSLTGRFGAWRKSLIGRKSKARMKSGPPEKFRKIETEDQGVASVPNFSYSEDLLEAARRLNFMAGTQELDRLLEELRLTSMQMTKGLPPPDASNTSRAYSYSQPYTPRQSTMYNCTSMHNRHHTTRSSSAIGLYGNAGGIQEHNARIVSTNPSNYAYHRQTSCHTDRRLDGFIEPAHYSSFRSTLIPSSSQRHHTTYTTVLKQRPPVVPKQFTQVHLTIDPDMGAAETSPSSSSFIHDRDESRREQKLESELISARREIAQLRRAMSLVEERQRQDKLSDYRTTHPSTPLTSARSLDNPPQQFASNASNSYQTHYSSTKSTASTFQRTSPRPDGPYASAFPLPKRAMSQTNVHGTRSWNLRSHLQGSESDLAYKRVTSVSNPSGRPGYSAHRERLRQEREQEVLLRHQHQLAASSTGLNENLHHQNRHHQQYRSMSAVNQTSGMSDAFEEIETIILQPIGRGVQDIDSRAGSMTTLPRGTGGSMMEGLHRTDGLQRTDLNKRGFSSTQFLNRGTSNSELIRPTPVHQSQTMIMPTGTVQPPQTPRFGTPITVTNGPVPVQLNRSRSQLSNASSTMLAATPTPSMTNGWKMDPVKRPNLPDNADTSNLGIVQDTASAWYRPNLSRETAISILRQQPPGSFLIRDSTTFKGAFGLAVKVATLPPKVTPKTDDLQSELVRHYLIEVVNTPTKGVRLKGFASEPVFPSLASLIHQHTYDPLALPCRLLLPPVTFNLPSSGCATLPPLVIGVLDQTPSTNFDDTAGMDNVTVTSVGNLFGRTQSETESPQIDGGNSGHQPNNRSATNVNTDDNLVTSPNVPFVCVLRESPQPPRSPLDNAVGQGLTFRCFMLGSVDTPQWDNELCFARAVDQLIPLTVLTAAECDHGVSRVRYTEVQLHVSAHDGITIIDLQRRLFLRRHLPNHILLYCGLEPRKKEFSHPEHQAQGIVHPQIFGIVVRKGISECTTHVFSECDPTHTTDSIVQHIRNTYPHMNVR